MKLAKKFMTLALATALGVGCATVGVSAAGSRTSAITVSAEQSAIYEVVQKIEEAEGFADLQAELPAVADAFKQVNEGKYSTGISRCIVPCEEVCKRQRCYSCFWRCNV